MVMNYLSTTRSNIKVHKFMKNLKVGFIEIVLSRHTYDTFQDEDEDEDEKNREK